MNGLPRLYAIADAAFGNPVQLAEELFAGGARLIQLRYKTADSATLLREAEAILKLQPRDGALLVNDRADVALICEAAGVHLGQTDLAPHLARGILAGDQIIGY